MPTRTYEAVNNRSGGNRVREQIGVFAGKKMFLEKVLEHSADGDSVRVQRASAFVDRSRGADVADGGGTAFVDRSRGADVVDGGGTAPLTQMEKFGMRFPGTVPVAMRYMIREELRGRVFGASSEIGNI
ncbi:MAG: hypothetical protein WCT46_00695 [Candidatus Gracilibacteria bacterium]